MKLCITVALTFFTVNSANIHFISEETVPKGRITEGQNATIDRFPYQFGVLVKRSNSDTDFLCGGSVIKNEWLLTAAHCMRDMVSAIVYLGATNFKHSEKKYRIKPEDVTMHPNWNAITYKNDIALIKMPFTNYSENIKAVNLPSNFSANYVGEKAVMSGWGLTADGNLSQSDILQWASFEIIDNETCGKALETKIRPSNMCIATSNGVSTCHGDSGGPLVLPSTNVQIGIDSYRLRQGCQKGYPVIFTRITSYLQWIQDNTVASNI